MLSYHGLRQEISQRELGAIVGTGFRAPTIDETMRQTDRTPLTQGSCRRRCRLLDRPGRMGARGLEDTLPPRLSRPELERGLSASNTCEFLSGRVRRKTTLTFFEVRAGPLLPVEFFVSRCRGRFIERQVCDRRCVPIARRLRRGRLVSRPRRCLHWRLIS